MTNDPELAADGVEDRYWVLCKISRWVIWVWYSEIFIEGVENVLHFFWDVGMIGFYNVAGCQCMRMIFDVAALSWAKLESGCWVLSVDGSGDDVALVDDTEFGNWVSRFFHRCVIRCDCKSNSDHTLDISSHVLLFAVTFPYVNTISLPSPTKEHLILLLP